MQNIIIDEEFRFLLPALDDDTFARLEESLLQNGCRDALVLWNGIIIDGYNRYTICVKHDIPFNTIDMEFDSREDVLIWIITNQVSRRNLTPIQLSHFRGVHYRAEKKSQSENSRHAQNSAKRQNDVLQKSTAKLLADRYKVSPRTIDRDAKTAAAIDAIGEESPEVKRMILAGEVKINRDILKDFSSLPKDELSDTAAEIKNGTFIREAPLKPLKDNKRDLSSFKINNAKTFDTFLSDVVSVYDFDVQGISTNGISAKSKSSLRKFIDKLEELYKQI